MKLKLVVQICCSLMFLTVFTFGQNVSLVSIDPGHDMILANLVDYSTGKVKESSLDSKPTMADTKSAFPMVNSVNIQLIANKISEKIEFNFPRPSNELTTVEILSSAGEMIFTFMLPPSNKSHILHLQNLKLENGNYDVNILNGVINKTYLLQIEN